MDASEAVLRVADVRFGKLSQLLGRFGLSLQLLADDAPITGSFWGQPEEGIVKRSVYVRLDTPIHSLLHETCHLVCMDGKRRSGVERDAGGDDLEESAVCYLQILLADCLPGVGRVSGSAAAAPGSSPMRRMRAPGCASTACCGTTARRHSCCANSCKNYNYQWFNGVRTCGV